ncbi:5-methyltetrahydropteroyltriglutamate--homocysteine S-methyltransferase [Haematospirillum sp. H1815]|uniref:5-methyltetrahydropteroyltriglutamate-- homocysteine S-methyltransferase n=1 Tax=Haematospirillum sp. H1815 TaxID=2723108 RepID=UPI002AC35272|nr:5-methyltetrahydropteroyltriglutamate--homocysteine S-methyltransferase [Haematospirillum sp. H1815]
MTISSLSVATLGMPRIGRHRELKFALEDFWKGNIAESALVHTATKLKARNWARQIEQGATILPSNDFSLYDHVLDTSTMVGAIPERYDWKGGPPGLTTYFAMARGTRGTAGKECHHACNPAYTGAGIPAQDMTKWFDTNYHYMVPEFTPGQPFRLSCLKAVNEYREARLLGYRTRPVLLGPVTFLKLGKSTDPIVSPLRNLDSLLLVYIDLLTRLSLEGADWIQIDEPCLITDLDDEARTALQTTYQAFARALPNLNIMLTTWFGGLGDNLDLATLLPVAGLHLDLVRAPEQLPEVIRRSRREQILSLGVIDGRNVWRADLEAILDQLEPAVKQKGAENIQLAPSCSLLHVPLDISVETDMDSDIKSWLSFADQKIHELAVLATALARGKESVRGQLEAASLATRARKTSDKIHCKTVQDRVNGIKPHMTKRKSPYAVRASQQQKDLALPLFPTTTIGSFPQTGKVRQARSAHRKGILTTEDYELFLRKETERVVRWQEQTGLDVLVHGEFERNDMVQYFGEKLSGFAFTRHGWVQSYGSRCVRPPILYGDISRPEPMTVTWWSCAQAVTSRPVKGMLTGPVTILNWSFVRDDIPRSTACRQLALALRDEVLDLEKAGARIIQIDEAALREGLPLRQTEWNAYLEWAVACFHLTSSGVSDHTQIHTHMCYSEFNDIMEAIAAMDADVVSIEASRSGMDLLETFRTYRYPNSIGPGVYDIHSPRIPGTDEIVARLAMARQYLHDRQLWINPDCGLKTRAWDDIQPALLNMVAAARKLRISQNQEQRNVQSALST